MYEVFREPTIDSAVSEGGKVSVVMTALSQET